MNENGYTFIELIFVVVIIAILVAISLPHYKDVRENAQAAACRENQNAVEKAAEIEWANEFFENGEGKYPNSMKDEYFRGDKQPVCPFDGDQYKTNNGGYDNTTGEAACPNGILKHSRFN